MNFNILDNLTINLYEGVISTGIERGLEWYYLYPLSSYVMEDKHEISRYDGQDSSYSIGKGDNDNHFTGFSVRYNNNKYQLYSELLVDEWQLDKESRDNMQTVFGFVLSIGYNLYKSNNIIFEYALASPWLYTNRGIFGSLEKHYQPLGLKDPKSQYFGILFTRKVENRQLKFMLRKQHKSYQNMYTKWDAWDNKIDLFEFEKSNSFESSFEYINNEMENISIYWE